MNVKVEAWKIYQDYKIHLGKTETPRSGFAYCGIYEISEKLARDRPESIAEHSDGVLHLIDSVARFLPEFIPPEDTLLAMRVALWHDAAEIRIGNIPDDGRRNEGRKDYEERTVFSEMTRRWPEENREVAKESLRDFQEHGSKLAQMLYCLDKLDAVLKALHYEHLGRAGSVLQKEGGPSEQDQHFAEACGSDSIGDVWGMHAVERTKGCFGHEIVLWVLEAAMQDVRGSNLPKWLIDELRI